MSPDPAPLAARALQVSIRPATDSDDAAIWRVVEPVLRAGEAYALPVDWGREAALAYWRHPQHEVFVAEAGGEVVGTCFLRANRPGGGAHVANAGFMTLSRSRGRGIARTMFAHVADRAVARGFSAIQYNFVVSTNEPAVRLWEGLGFSIVGRVPRAFAHPRLGLVDVLIMHRFLGGDATAAR